MLEHFRGKKWDVIVRQLMLIEHQTYTPSKEDVDEIVEYITDQVNPLKPSSIEQMPQENIGDMLLFKWHENAPGKPIMVLMHMDTVHPLHKIGEDMPFGIDDDTERIMGPGAISMKGGICAAITAVEGLIEREELPKRPLWMLFVSDMETGGHASLPVIEILAPQCGLVLVMDSPVEDSAPQPPTDEPSQAAATQIRQLAASIGLTDFEATAGMAGERTLALAHGVPAVGGLGPHGSGARTHDEDVIIRSVCDRAALVAVLLRDWTF